jgi:hypothetical protein
LPLPRPLSGIIEIFRNGEPDPILSWRTPKPIQSLPVWAEGSYTVLVAGRRYPIQTRRRT